MVKVISLSAKAYSRLKELKDDEKSFSDVVLELTDAKKPRRNLSEFNGALADRAAEWESIKNEIYDSRKAFRLREVKT